MNESILATVAVSATRPILSSDGVSVTHWRANGAFAPPLAVVFLDGSTAQTITVPTGGSEGVELWGYRLSTWWKIGFLHNAADIVIAGASQGFAQEVNILGVFERLAVAGTPSSGTTQASFAPIDHWTGPQ